MISDLRFTEPYKIISILKHLTIAFSILVVLSFTAATFVNPPEAEISNSIIKAHLYLPDAENGYYRGSRFDWSGVISSLTCEGHSYFGKWFPRYSPTLHDAIMGPVEDFYPVGFEEAKPGGSFLKIGIGIMERPDTAKYSIVPPYKILNPGKWKVKVKSNEAQFHQTLKDENYSYEYHKSILLTDDKPQMILSHTLKNTGKKLIETNVYDHNFFMLDSQAVGPGYVIRFNFEAKAEGTVSNELGKLENREITYPKNLETNQHLYYKAISGFSNDAIDYDISVENKNTGAGVKITSDQPLSKMVYWSAHTTVCPEPYIHISIKPGESFSWKIFYDFYSIKK